MWLHHVGLSNCSVGFHPRGHPFVCGLRCMHGAGQEKRPEEKNSYLKSPLYVDLLWLLYMFPLPLEHFSIAEMPLLRARNNKLPLEHSPGFLARHSVAYLTRLFT